MTISRQSLVVSRYAATLIDGAVVVAAEICAKAGSWKPGVVS